MRNKALDYSLKQKRKATTLIFEDCCALLHVSLIIDYSVMKAKRNTAQLVSNTFSTYTWTSI
jgi:hypothetical protein